MNRSLQCVAIAALVLSGAFAHASPRRPNGGRGDSGRFWAVNLTDAPSAGVGAPTPAAQGLVSGQSAVVRSGPRAAYRSSPRAGFGSGRRWVQGSGFNGSRWTSATAGRASGGGFLNGRRNGMVSSGNGRMGFRQGWRRSGS